MFLSAVVVANIFLLVISFLYVFYSSLLTRMLVAMEWASLAKKSKFLRVSEPKGMQRSSYFLSVPFRYGTPLMISMATLHWLVSQSIFVAKTIGWAADGQRRMDLVF